MTISTILKHTKTMTKIGTGNYGIVYLINLKRDNVWCKYSCNFCHRYSKYGDIAIKQTPTKDDTTQEDMKNEYEFHKYCYQHNKKLYVSIYDFWIERSVRGLLNDYPIPKTNGFYVMEYMNCGSLVDYLKTGNYIHIIKFICMILYIIYYTHNVLEVCHGDISWENLFVSHKNTSNIYKLSIDNKKDIDINLSGFQIKLGDFGIAEKFNKNMNNQLIKRDYIIFHQMNQNTSIWKDLLSEIHYNKMLIFIRENILKYLYKDDSINYIDQHIMWNTLQHLPLENSNIYFKDLSKKILIEYIDFFEL